MGYNRSKVRTFLTATVQFEWLLETYANLLIFRHVPWQTRYDELCEYRELHGKCWCHYCTCYCTCFDSLLCSSSISRPLYNPPPIGNCLVPIGHKVRLQSPTQIRPLYYASLLTSVFYPQDNVKLANWVSTQRQVSLAI